MRSILLAFLTLALVSGCYLSFGLERPPHGSRVDMGGRPAPAADASVDAYRERPDVGPVLPVEPEPDAGPDERPTGPWVDVPPPPAGKPALVPVGEVVQLDDEFDSGGQPTLVWNDSGWGVAWDGHFRVLDADGRPADATVSTITRPADIGLDFAIGRYAIAVGTSYWGSEPQVLGALDRRGTLAAGWENGVEADNVDVGRLASAHQWVVGTSRSTGGGSYVISAYAADDEMRRLGAPIELATDGIGDVRVAGAKSRAVVAWTTPYGVMAQVLKGPTLVRDGEPFRVMAIGQQPDSGIEVESYRDLVAVTAMGGRSGGVQVAVIDAWAHEVTSGPIAVGDSGIMDRRPGLSVAPEHGFFVACWSSGRGAYGGMDGHDSIALQVIGARGGLWGGRLDLVVDEPNVGGVDCGWNGSEIVVVWWRASGPGDYNSIFSQRVRPTFL